MRVSIRAWKSQHQPLNGIPEEHQSPSTRSANFKSSILFPMPFKIRFPSIRHQISSSPKNAAFAKAPLDPEETINEPVLPAYPNRPSPIPKPDIYLSVNLATRPCITRPRHPYPSSPSSKGAPQTHPLKLPNWQVGPPRPTTVVEVPPARPRLPYLLRTRPGTNTRA